jgi:3'(2'), 5'-bisphosphate nucleotidase
MPYQAELQAAVAAMRLAQKALLELYEAFVPIPNAPSTITTDADRQSQEIVLQHLSQAFPGDAFRAEETTPTLATLPTMARRTWIIDPIDGTRGFARKNGEFSIMVGLVEEGKILVGAVLEPVRDRLTYAVAGGGCWSQDKQGPAVSCRLNPVQDLHQATMTQSHSRDPAKPNRYVQALQPARLVETYSAGIKLALVARGEADIYLNDYDAMHDWDLCAGHILVEEAGGQVTSLPGQALTYGKEDHWHRHGVLATNPVLHPQVLAALRHAPAL